MSALRVKELQAIHSKPTNLISYLDFLTVEHILSQSPSHSTFLNFARTLRESSNPNIPVTSEQATQLKSMLDSLLKTL